MCQIFILLERRQNNNGRYTFGSIYILAQLSSAYIRTHTSTTYSNSCIDLIFTDQSNLIVNRGTYSSLNSKCHLQITYCKLNLNVEYPALYERLVWDYKKANIDNIKNPIVSVNWEFSLNNKTVIIFWFASLKRK